VSIKFKTEKKFLKPKIIFGDIKKLFQKLKNFLKNFKTPENFFKILKHF